MRLPFLCKSLIFSLIVFLNLGSTIAPPLVPATGTGTTHPVLNGSQISLQDFSAGLPSGSDLVGIYTTTFAYPVLQQPRGNPGFVSKAPDKVTQFGLASQFGTVGLLAHNNLAGATFSSINTGETITLIYGDGHLLHFRVTTVERFQALSPESPTSNFLSIDHPSIKLSASDLFNHIYKSAQHLVLQTCIKSNGNPSWGRLFIIAEPIQFPALLVSYANSFIGTAY